MSFLSDSLIACGGAVEASGRPVRSCRLQRDTGFAFVELRTAEEASNAMALDGLVFRETALRVRVARSCGDSTRRVLLAGLSAQR
jgi:splicing factor U2AF subunit